MIICLMANPVYASSTSEPKARNCYIRAQDQTPPPAASWLPDWLVKWWFGETKTSHFPCFFSEFGMTATPDLQGNFRWSGGTLVNFHREDSEPHVLSVSHFRPPNGELTEEKRLNGEPYTESRHEEAGVRGMCYRSAKLAFCVKDEN